MASRTRLSIKSPWHGRLEPGRVPRHKGGGTVPGVWRRARSRRPRRGVPRPRRRSRRRTENLSYQSFGAVSRDRAAQLPGGGDSEPPALAAVGQEEHRAVAAPNADSMVVHVLIIGPPADPLPASESHARPTIAIRR